MSQDGEFSADGQTLLTGEAVVLDVRPASFILRAAGALVDLVCYLTLFVVTLLGLGIVSQFVPVDDALAQALTICSLVFCIVIVPTVVETLLKGRSVGKLVVGARIVRVDGGAATFRHALIRALTGVIEIYLSAGGIAIIVGLVTTRSQRLGDLLAGTYSQHERVPPHRPNARPLPAELVSWAAVADVARMPDSLSRRIAQFLASADQLSPHARTRIAHELAHEASPFISPLPNVHPERLLEAVAVIRRDRELAALGSARDRLARLGPIHVLPHGFPDR